MISRSSRFQRGFKGKSGLCFEITESEEKRKINCCIPFTLFAFEEMGMEWGGFNALRGLIAPLLKFEASFISSRDLASCCTLFVKKKRLIFGSVHRRTFL